MKVLRKVRDIELNEGNSAANGLFNLSKEDSNSLLDLSFWFDIETKDLLMGLNDAEFWHQANDMIKESNIDTFSLI